MVLLIARTVGMVFFVLGSLQSSVHAIDNMRVAHPSISASVLCLMIANKEGYFKEEGINVEFLSIRGEIAIRTTLAGEIDFFTNAGSALAAVARNVPVKILAVFQDKPGWDLIALPNIKSIAQLRGQTVAIMSPEGSLAVVTREILRKNGLDPAKDANLVVMGGDDVRFLAQSGHKRSPRVADAPTIYELMDEYKTAPTKRRVAEAMLQGGEWARPLIAPPATPADRVKILRDAYEKVAKDPDLIAEAKKLAIDVTPLRGEQLQKTAIEVIKQPPEVVEQIKKLFVQ